MKRFLAILLTGLALVSNAFALRGGPFDSDLPTGGINGVYQFTERFTNGVGISRVNLIQFDDYSSYSRSIKYINGSLYVGDAYLDIDYNDKTVVGATNTREQILGLTSEGATGTDGSSAAEIRTGQFCSSNFEASITSASSGIRVTFSGVGTVSYYTSVPVYNSFITGRTVTTEREIDAETGDIKETINDEYTYELRYMGQNTVGMVEAPSTVFGGRTSTQFFPNTTKYSGQ